MRRETASNPQRYEARAKIARALAHPTLLMFLDVLSQKGEMCICELTDLAAADQNTVSKHLVILRDSGLVNVRKNGVWTYYSIRCTCVESFFGCIETVLAENLKQQQELISC